MDADGRRAHDPPIDAAGMSHGRHNPPATVRAWRQAANVDDGMRIGWTHFIRNDLRRPMGPGEGARDAAAHPLL